MPGRINRWDNTIISLDLGVQIRGAAVWGEQCKLDHAWSQGSCERVGAGPLHLPAQATRFPTFTLHTVHSTHLDVSLRGAPCLPSSVCSQTYNTRISITETPPFFFMV